MLQFFSGASVFDGECIRDDVGVLVEDGVVLALRSADEIPEQAQHVPLDPSAMLVPGFLDLQINGAGGILFNTEPTAETARHIAKSVRCHGVTRILPTLITDCKETLATACQTIGKAAKDESSGVLGIHVEGPFISVERKGIHKPSYIRVPEEEDLIRLTELSLELRQNGARLLLTIAPENVPDDAIARLAQSGVVVSAGHTAASYERIHEAIANGVTGFTHLGNAMPPIQNREPGPVAAALASRDTWCGLIVDGHHIHPGLMKVMLAAKPEGKMFLVTDAMPPVGTDMQSFELYGQTIHRSGGRLVSSQGVLAGADIDMANAVRNCTTLLDLPLTEALRMASLYPASHLGLDSRFGRIAPGYTADFALITKDVEPLETFVAGRSVWKKSEA